ncbi:hypothetical protein MOQ72_29950 [Saccharopolyspora sp. K220]|uniref:hypothetical protein n=1 Tax=Saccharopolyspora soli TaxID=2926618 RepID=UPI001F55BD68|nr:hypothetical protein [Saccharopolyspora soli]MCI2421666.1 hypothetical protein [Saccharopolyspora soli]
MSGRPGQAHFGEAVGEESSFGIVVGQRELRPTRPPVIDTAHDTNFEHGHVITHLGYA